MAKAMLLALAFKVSKEAEFCGFIPHCLGGQSATQADAHYR